MIDIDGNASYSQINLLDFTAPSTIRAYPNPAKDMLTISGIESGIELRLLNVQGQQIMNVISTDNTMQLNISKLAAATYILQVVQKNEAVKNIKVVKE